MYSSVRTHISLDEEGSMRKQNGARSWGHAYSGGEVTPRVTNTKNSNKIRMDKTK